MNSFSHATTVSVFIECDSNEVYEFTFNLENFPTWVGLCQSIRQENGDWIMETTHGSMKVRTTKRNDLGIIDHFVSTSSETEFDAMRILPNGAHSEVFMTVFQHDGMPDEDYKQMIEVVKEDLQNLKSIIEKQSSSSNFGGISK
ncbi:hypothetical protein [Bacillus horti]|uniref:SRPBCC family protein n=1 Tax=Caldalkalibacillus horti TaxID=77523 RepID=A0ABT9VWI8_9BACI|nr:hypothetical protein [Bacillus horti]MDQ0165342.1 hypothetical protein [Bacillus horti]